MATGWRARLGAALRPAALASALFVGLATLHDADPTQWAVVVLAVALVAGAAGGRFAKGLGLPPVLGMLGTGALMGPGLSHAIARVWGGWPLSEGLLDLGVLSRAESLMDIASAVAGVWIGTRLEPRRLSGSTKGVLAMFAGYAVVLLGLVGLIGTVALAGSLGSSAASFAETPEHVAGVAVGLVATSTLLTGAVVHGANAAGRVTRTILWLAMLGEGAAFAGFVGWVSWTGAASVLGLADPGGLVPLVFTVVVGAVGGLLFAAASANSTTRSGPWVVIGAALSGPVAAQAGLSVLLVGLTAGLVLAIVRPDDDAPFLDVAAGAAFVVLFTLAGARVPLGMLLSVAPVALTLAVGRGLLLFGAAIGGGRLLRVDPAVVRYAWTGLAASAIPVAGLVPWRAVGDGSPDVATASLWGLAVLDGLLGGLAVHTALRLAHETPGSEVVPPPPEASGWRAHERLPEGPLRDAVLALGDDLGAVVRDVRFEVGQSIQREVDPFLDELRLAFLRHHRRVGTLISSGDTGPGLRAAQADMAERWRSHVMDHTVHMNRDPWRAETLFDVLDRVAMQTPASVPLPRAAGWPSDVASGFRMFTAWLVGAGGRQSVPLRDLLRAQLSHTLAARLEAVAAVVVNTELHLAARTRELFFRALDAHGGDPRLLTQEAMVAARDDLEDDVRGALEEIAAREEGLARRLDAVLGGLLDELVATLERMVAAELPPRAGSAARTATERDRARAALAAKYDQGREVARIRFAALTLEMELGALELEVRGALAEHGRHLARLVRGRGATQLVRVEDAVDEMLEAVDAVLATDVPAVDVAEALREGADELARVATDAAGTADDLREHLASDEALAPLLDALMRAGNHLTDRYEVPVGTAATGSWALPEPVATREVPFREVVLGYIESAIRRDLVDLTAGYVEALDRVVKLVEEIDRVAGFDAELAAAELLVAPSVTLADAKRASVREIVQGGLAPLRTQLSELRAEGEGWFEDLDHRIQQAVLDDLADLRVRVADGRFAEILAERPAPAGPRMVEGAEDLLDRADRALREWVGDAGMDAFRHQLGLYTAADLEEPTPERFVRPAIVPGVPTSYRRLFSEQALEAGELIGGGETSADRVREALENPRDGRLRTVAVVGPDGVGQPAVVRAALRAMRLRGVVRHELDRPVFVDEVARWFDRGAQGHVHVVGPLHHLYTLKPGGFEPLRRFVEGVLADAGRNAWVVQADDVAWTFASAVAPLERAFPSVVPVIPLGVEELQDALLARHAMSGLSLEVAGGGLDRRVRTRSQAAWFRDLHEASGGVARDAMHLWLAAIQTYDDVRDRIVMGEVPAVPLAAMRHLSDRSALALRIASLQGWIDAATWTRLVREPELDARAHIAHLVHWGVLQADEERFVLPAHLRRVIHRVIDERGWV